jgi:hypothetical protein
MMMMMVVMKKGIFALRKAFHVLNGDDGLFWGIV